MGWARWAGGKGGKGGKGESVGSGSRAGVDSHRKQSKFETQYAGELFPSNLMS